MSFKVELKPSGHHFLVEARESLLDAGLRDGLNLDHLCANGSCGACKARLLSGDLSLSQHYDYRFSEQEKSDNWFLMCCHRPASDVQVLVHETGSVAEIPEQHIRAKLSKLESLGNDVLQLHVRTPRSNNLQFLAGQAVSLHFDGMRPQRMSIASCPCDGMNLRFHLRRRVDDPFSDFIFNRARKGREVVLVGPHGNFTLDEDSARPRVFVAWETGFAAIASLIDHAIQLDEDRETHLYWLSVQPSGHYLPNHCRAWQDALDNFHYHPLELRASDPQALQAALHQIAQAHPSLASWDFYLSLPGEAEVLLPQLGLEGCRFEGVGQA